MKSLDLLLDYQLSVEIEFSLITLGRRWRIDLECYTYLTVANLFSERGYTFSQLMKKCLNVKKKLVR